MKHLPLIFALLTGCAHVDPITTSRERVDETPQRVHDLQFHCERCGDVAVENVSEVADEESWRCKACAPRDVMPRMKPKPRKLKTEWA